LGERRPGVHLAFECFDERGMVAASGRPRARRRHHAGAKFANHLSGDIGMLGDLRRVEAGEHELARFIFSL